MRKRIAILAVAAAMLIPASALAQNYVYSQEQHGTIGSIVAASDQNGNSKRVILPNSLVARGIVSRLDITTPTLVIVGPHIASTVCVVTAGSTAGTVNDSATTAAAAIANEVAPIPNVAGCNQLDWPFANGIVIVPGTGQVVTVSFN